MKKEEEIYLRAGSSKQKEINELKKRKEKLNQLKKRQNNKHTGKKAATSIALVATGLAVGFSIPKAHETNVGKDIIADNVYDVMVQDGYVPNPNEYSDGKHIIVRGKDQEFDESIKEELIKNLKTSLSDTEIEIGLDEIFGDNDYIEGVSKDDIKKEIRYAYLEKEQSKLKM